MTSSEVAQLRKIQNKKQKHTIKEPPGEMFCWSKYRHDFILLVALYIKLCSQVVYNNNYCIRLNNKFSPALATHVLQYNGKLTWLLGCHKGQHTSRAVPVNQKLRTEISCVNESGFTDLEKVTGLFPEHIKKNTLQYVWQHSRLKYTEVLIICFSWSTTQHYSG